METWFECAAGLLASTALGPGLRGKHDCRWRRGAEQASATAEAPYPRNSRPRFGGRPSATERRHVFGPASFRVVPRLRKPTFGVGAHSRLVQSGHLVWTSDDGCLVGSEQHSDDCTRAITELPELDQTTTLDGRRKTAVFDPEHNCRSRNWRSGYRQRGDRFRCSPALPPVARPRGSTDAERVARFLVRRSEGGSRRPRSSSYGSPRSVPATTSSRLPSPLW